MYLMNEQCLVPQNTEVIFLWFYAILLGSCHINEDDNKKLEYPT